MKTPDQTRSSGLKPNRRELLGLSAAAAGAWASTALTSAVAADGVEPVRTAVIGTGGRGSDLIRSLTTIEGCDLVAIADDYPPHLEKAAKFAGPQAKQYSDYHKLLDEVKPAAVVIAVPLYLHYRVASDALQAGCDVFCEKTMCHTVDEARKLAEEVERAKAVFQVGLQRRANPIYQQAAAMVQSGVLGQVTAVKAQWHRNNNWRRPVPVPKGHADWTKLERKLNWRLYREYSGGLMTELGSHQLDVVNWLLGDIPKRVIASGGIDYWRDGREVCDNVFCLYEYELPPLAGPRPDPDAVALPNGGTNESSLKPYTVRVIYSSLCNNAYEGAAELVMGTKGTLYLTSNKGLFYREKLADDVGWSAKKTADGGSADASVVISGKTLKLSNSPWAHRGEPLEIDNLLGDDTRDELVSFLDHVRREDVKTICDAREGLRDTATVLTANRAIDEQTSLAIPRV
jgi:predicted dehydrogenase